MANYRAVANGNWSALATWQDNSTGSFVASTVLPGISDDVWSNNFTVTVDVNISVNSLRNVAETNISAGGGFIFNAGTVAAISFECIGGNSVLISPNGNVSFTIASGYFRLNGTAGGLVNNTGTSNVVTIIGSGENNGAGQFMRNSSSGTIILTGNYIAGTGSVSYAVQNAGNGVINITGNVFANLGVGIFQNSAGTVNQIGELHASSGANGLSSTNATATNNLSGPFFNVSNKMAVLATNMTLVSTSPTYWQFNTNVPLTNKTLYTDDNVGGAPATTNVRQGTVYGISGALTGTLAVPSPSNVRQGVPTDNTVGTAALTPADFWDYLSANATTVGSLGKQIADNLDVQSSAIPANVVTELGVNPDPVAERIRNLSTVQTTGDQIAAAL